MRRERRPDPASIDLGVCDGDQLRALLALAAAPRTLEELLATRPIPVIVAQQLTEALGGDDHAGADLLAAVGTPGASLAALREVKDVAKTLAGRSRRPSHRTAATFLYLAAIAAAAARHGLNISSIPLTERRALYVSIADALADDPLGALFRAAAAVKPERPHAR